MDRDLLLTLTGVLLGVAIAIMWWPVQQAPPPDEDTVIEDPPPIIEIIPPGRRGVLLDQDDRPVQGIVVHLTQLRPDIHRYYPATLTNYAGYFRIDVPVGWYRVQALAGFNNVVDRVIHVAGADHPDIEVRLVRVPLLHFVGN